MAAVGASYGAVQNFTPALTLCQVLASMKRWFFFLGGPLNHNRPRIPTWAHRSMILTLTGQPDRIRSHGNETYTDPELACRNKYLGFFLEKD